MKRLSQLLALSLTLVVFGGAAFALEVPPPPAQWVTDRAGVLDFTQVDALNRKLQAFEQRSGAQFIIYILPSLEDDSLEDFTIRAAEKWKAGGKKVDNGLILFAFINDRKLRIEVGYGLEGTVTDAVSAQVIRNQIAPQFRNNQYAAGLNAAADTLIALIEKKEVPVPLNESKKNAPRGFSGVDPIMMMVIFFIFVFFIGPLLFGRRRQRGGCGGCGGCFPLFLPMGGPGITFGGGGGGWGGGGGFSGGGFSGGGGSFGGGGASGGW